MTGFFRNSGCRINPYGHKYGVKYFIPGVFVSIVFFVFAPIELYFTNQSEFWFSLTQILPIFFLLTILTIVLLAVLLYCMPERKAGFFEAFVYGFAFLAYLQGNYIPNDYGSLNGEEIKWGNYTLRLIVDAVVWIAVLAMFLYLVYRYREAALNKMRLAVVFMSLFILLSLLIVGISYQGTNEKKQNQYLSEQGLYNISSESNTIVILLDCFDSEVMYTLIQKQPDYIISRFKDFVYYHNTVGGATRTKYAIPFIFTGVTNTEDVSYPEYIEKAYKSSPLIKELETGNYDVGVYTTPTFIDMSLGSTTINNIVDGSSEVSSIAGLAKDYYKIVGFKYAPDIAKKNFWLYSGDLNNWMKTGDDLSPYSTGDDVLFYNNLRERGLNITTEKPCFRFIHLNGAHPPYSMDENCERIDIESGNEEKQAVGSLNIAYEYITEMKQLGVYDSATIIVMSDHGGGRGIEQNPLFMVKLPFADSDFETSDISLSYRNLNEIMLASLKGIIDLENYIVTSPRYFYVESEEGSLVNITEYVSEGYAYDNGSFHETGVVYHGDTQSLNQKYTLGTKISFAEGENARAYIEKGIRKNEGTHSWTEGNELSLYFELEGKYQNIELEYNYVASYGIQPVIIYTNDVLVGSYIAREGETKKFVIPGDCIEDNKLLLSFYFPSAISPEKKGESSDNRLLALALKDLTLSSTEKGFDLNSQIEAGFRIDTYCLGEDIIFTSDDRITERYLSTGFSENEPDGVWTIDKEANMSFYIEEDIKSDDLEIELHYIPFNGKQSIETYINDVLVDHCVAEGLEVRTIQIPGNLIKEGELNLKFELPDAVSPESLGMSEDSRKLALKFSYVKICKVEHLYSPTISFKETNNTAKEYIVEGFSDAEQEFTWTEGERAELEIPVVQSKEDLDLVFHAGGFNGRQRAIFYIDGVKLREMTVGDEGEYKIKIPAKYTDDEIMNISIYLPDAKSPYNIGLSDDKRILGLRFVDMKLVAHGEED